MPFTFERTEIPDVIIITPAIFEDLRGHFVETYKRTEFSKFGIPEDFRQDNYSLSKKGVARGLHYQADPFSQGKLMRAISGKIFEVAVDIRRGSPYFGKWVSVIMTQENRAMIWIPEGFAAGMMSLEEDSRLAYKTTNEYSKAHECGIKWNDPAIGIKWPIDIKPLVSEKDEVHPLLKDAEINFVYKK